MAKVVFLQARYMAMTKKFKIILAANLLWLAWLMVGLVFASYSRHIEPTWADMSDMKLKYDLLYLGGVGSLSLLAFVGLLLRKKWGYSIAVVVNATISLLTSAIFLASIYMTRLQFFDVLKMNATNLVAGFVSFVLLLSLISKEIKGAFTKAM